MREPWNEIYVEPAEVARAIDAGHEPLYMEQPLVKPPPGLHPEQLVQVIKGVFGLPDAPRRAGLRTDGGGDPDRR